MKRGFLATVQVFCDKYFEIKTRFLNLFSTKIISKIFEPHILLSGKHDFLGAVTGQLTSIKEKGEFTQWFDLQGNEVKSGRILMSLLWLEAVKDKALLIGELVIKQQNFLS